MSKGFTGIRQAEAQDLRVVDPVQQVQLGATGQDVDGNLYTYGQAGSSTVPHGQLAVASATVANHTNQNVAVASNVGDRQLSLTLGATAATADQYREGFLVINSGTGAGYTFKIKGHGAVAASGTLVVYTEEPIPVAVPANAKYSLYANPAKGVSTSTTLGKAVGVPLVDVAANNYGWFQRTGLASVLADGAVTKGFAVEQSNATAGAVKVSDALTDQVVGVANEALVTTEYRAVTLQIVK